MFFRIVLCTAVLSLPACAYAEGSTCAAAISGFVTAVDVSSGLRVESYRIVQTPKTKFFTGGKHTSRVDTLPPLYVGQGIDVCGKRDKKSRQVTASEIRFYPHETAKVKGSAMIDLVPAPLSGATDLVFRADGYLLHVTPQTLLHMTPPLATVEQVGTNVWIDYRGERQLDGTVRVDEAYFQPNQIDEQERTLLAEQQFDPDAVDPAAKQNPVSKVFGVDSTKLPPHIDEDLQARVKRIGQGLIPAYQLALPESDPTRIHFRFEVVDAPGMRYVIALPNGIIQVPYAGVSRLKNDGQIAAQLAAAIASVLEKQELRYRLKRQGLTAASWAMMAGGFVVPGLGFGTVGTDGVRGHLVDLTLQQEERVSLCLMHDAGYDLAEAPISWWLLWPRKPKPFEEIGTPYEADYLYQTIGAVWKPAAQPVLP